MLQEAKGWLSCFLFAVWMTLVSMREKGLVEPDQERMALKLFFSELEQHLR